MRYLLTWKANASAWPTDPKQVLTILQEVFASADQLLETRPPRPDAVTTLPKQQCHREDGHDGSNVSLNLGPQCPAERPP